MLRFVIVIALFFPSAIGRCQDWDKAEGAVRFATYNIALNRKKNGELAKELESSNSLHAKSVAKVIQLVRPDVLLINELDYEDGRSAELFRKNYLQVAQDECKAIDYPYLYVAPVNTGVKSGLDLDGNGQMGGPNDALGYGHFPGQYGMVVYSNREFETDAIRSFQKFLWKDMPDAAWPTKKNGRPYYADPAKQIFRLSSKSHWDVPVKIDESIVHFLVCHPTPPVFDGPEDKNGCRNYDEIRLWSDYVSNRASYLYDDSGQKGGLDRKEKFIIAGDLNADPNDGDSRTGAIEQLLSNDLVNGKVFPKSTGGSYWAKVQGGMNAKHKGDPACDTGDFNDKRVGNMRIDYVLPSKNLKVAGCGVFWPKPEETGAKAVKASDHRLVWVDVDFD